MLGMILAAGGGSRLAPLTASRPKAAIPTFDVPQLVWQLARMMTAGVERVFVNAHHHVGSIQRIVGEASEELSIKTEVIFEPIALGTAGALKNIRHFLDKPFMVVNADTVTDVPLDLLREAHASAEGVATVLAIPALSDADLVVSEGWVTELIDRRFEASAGWLYGGAAVIDPAALDLIHSPISGLFETVLTGAISKEMGLAALVWEGYWNDVGTHESYLAANMDVLSGEVSAPLLVRGAIVEGSYMGPGSQGDIRDIRHSVVGAGARIEIGAELSRCVVWDGTIVGPGRYRDTIIGDGHIVKTKAP